MLDLGYLFDVTIFVELSFVPGLILLFVYVLELLLFLLKLVLAEGLDEFFVMRFLGL